MRTVHPRRGRAPLVPQPGARLGAGARLRLAAEVLAGYAQVRWRLRRHGLEPTLAFVRRELPPGAATAAPSPQSLLRLGHIVQRTLGALPLDSRCLIRSLVLTGLLARRGIPSVVVLAAALRPEFQAHSWVEHEGVALLPTGTGFERLKEL
ncbi:MAG TPA: lasso peptide biosynthesis B2 protein [Baekduia sp.]|nr:lasso peptide biosynthesis B2 protein [Baekduia sp.]